MLLGLVAISSGQVTVRLSTYTFGVASIEKAGGQLNPISYTISYTIVGNVATTFPMANWNIARLGDTIANAPYRRKNPKPLAT